MVNFVFIEACYIIFILATDSSMYAHFVFNVFDQDGDGTVSFEVCLIKENDSKCVLDYRNLC